MHEHSRTWRRPAGFDRFAWDYDGAFGSTARWGRWQRGIAVGAAERDILRRLDATIRHRLAAFGQGADYTSVSCELAEQYLSTYGPGAGSPVPVE